MIDRENEQLPLAGRKTEDVPGHWLLARLGKRVLRPGGLDLTRELLLHARLKGQDVVELAPGLGRTAAMIIAARPSSYVGVDEDKDAAAIVDKVVSGHGYCRTANASETGLPEACADVVIGEAMLTMQGTKTKQAIIAEVVRLLRPGGRYAIHELGLQPDDLDEQIDTEIRQALARTIKVNARPLTAASWRELLETHGLVVEWTGTADMALLKPRRNIADEGLLGTARIVRNLLRDAQARKRVLAMRKVFTTHRKSLTGIALVAYKPAARH